MKMAVPEAESDVAFVGSGEGELGDGQELYDLHGEGVCPCFLQERFVLDCRPLLLPAQVLSC